MIRFPGLFAGVGGGREGTGYHGCRSMHRAFATRPVGSLSGTGYGGKDIPLHPWHPEGNGTGRV